MSIMPVYHLAFEPVIAHTNTVKAVFWDRDGVLTEIIDRGEWGLAPPWTLDEFKFKPDAKQSIDLTRGNSFMNFVVTNQSDVELGKLSEHTLNIFNRMLKQWLHIDDVRCATSKSSPYYKPGNKMIEDLIVIHNVDRSKSWLVGDRWKDIVAGNRSGLRTVWIDHKEGEHVPDAYIHFKPDYVVYSTFEAAELIVGLENVQ